MKVNAMVRSTEWKGDEIYVTLRVSPYQGRERKAREIFASFTPLTLATLETKT